MREQFITVPLSADLHGLALHFDCGSSKNINAFLKSPKSLDLNYGKTFVLLDEGKTVIVGFYTLTTGLVEQESIKTGGSIHIRDFALDKAYRGKVQKVLSDGSEIKLSDVLLDDCIQRIENIRANHVGFSLITLFSTPEGESLYLRNGFDYAEEDMYMPKEEDDGLTKAMYRPVDIEFV